MDRNEATDEELMMRFGRGDAAAFEALYRRHETKVFRYLLRNIRNEASANDLMQDVWFAVARSAQRYEPTAKFTTWLFTLAHHRMIDLIRKTRPSQSLDEVGDDADNVPSLPDRLAADANLEPERAAHGMDTAQALLQAVDTLPQEQKTAFLMQAEGDLSVEEIAAATGTTFETVKSRLRYAKSKLRQQLWEFA